MCRWLSRWRRRTASEATPAAHADRLQSVAVASLYKIIETVEFALLILLSVSVSIHSLNLYGLSAFK